MPNTPHPTNPTIEPIRECRSKLARSPGSDTVDDIVLDSMFDPSIPVADRNRFAREMRAQLQASRNDPAHQERVSRLGRGPLVHHVDGRIVIE